MRKATEGSGPQIPSTAETLQKGEERFRRVFEHSNDAIFIIDPEKDQILDVNSKACSMLGFPREELLSMSISAIHPDEMPQLRAFSQAVFEKGSGWTNELTCLTKSGQALPSEISASVIEMDGRSCMIALVRDITARKQAEAALRASERRLASILESAMDAIITLDEEQRIILFNEAAEKMFHCPSAEAIGQPFSRFLCEPCRSLLLGYVQASDQSKDTKRTLWAPEGLSAMRAGEEFPIEATISRVEVSGQTLYTIILRDIDDRKKAEAELSKLQRERSYLQEEIRDEYNFEEIVGASAAIKKVFGNIESVATTDSTVLLNGETGTGKELVARAIHERSARKGSVMVKVNCAALPEGLIESELFGHEKGAFTGALSRKIGRFELANGGTIFLDEIGDLPLALQAKLLRVLQEGEFERLGSTQTIKVDVRVISATHHDLEKDMQEGRFRPDLYYRLNVFPIRIPPLRERPEDVSLLANYFVMKYSKRLGKKIETIPRKTMIALLAYSWPGNVRELANVIERAVILSSGPLLELGDWLGSVTSPQAVVTTRGSGVSTLEELEREHISQVLELTGWRVSGEKGAAKLLGLKPTTLEARMKKLGIQRKI